MTVDEKQNENNGRFLPAYLDFLSSFAALSLKPDEAVMYNLRSQVRGKIGLIEEAMSDYNKALDLEECLPAM